MALTLDLWGSLVRTFVRVVLLVLRHVFSSVILQVVCISVSAWSIDWYTT